MSGAEPAYLTAGFVLQEGLEQEVLERVCASMGKMAREAGVKIVAGDTKVVEGNGAGAQGGLYINTAGVGFCRWGQNLGAAAVRPGDALLLSGPLGNHHACILAQRLEITTSISSDCADLGPAVAALLKAGVQVRSLRDVTRGGLATVLNEIATAAGVTLTLEEKLLPVEEEVRGFCGLLGLDPLYMANEGKFLCIVAAADAPRALALLRQIPVSRGAALIGQAGPGENGPPVTLRTALGGRRILDVLYGEGLPRIC